MITSPPEHGSGIKTSETKRYRCSHILEVFSLICHSYL